MTVALSVALGGVAPENLDIVDRARVLNLIVTSDIGVSPGTVHAAEDFIDALKPEVFELVSDNGKYHAKIYIKLDDATVLEEKTRNGIRVTRRMAVGDGLGALGNLYTELRRRYSGASHYLRDPPRPWCRRPDRGLESVNNIIARFGEDIVIRICYHHGRVGPVVLWTYGGTSARSARQVADDMGRAIEGSCPLVPTNDSVHSHYTDQDAKWATRKSACEVCHHNFRSSAADFVPNADGFADVTPFMLPCNHVICGDCIANIKASPYPTKCPWCRSPF